MGDPTELFDAALHEQQCGRLDEAARLYQLVLAANPQHALAWHQWGLIEFAAHRYDLAYQRISRAILLEGDNAAFHHNMGACCRALGKLDDARASYQQALRFDPDFEIARAHLCVTLFALGRTADAQRLADDFMLRPRTTPELHSMCGTLALMRGDFATGWREHEWRLELPEHHWRAPRETKWDGTPLAGRTLLIHAEQGLGDVLQLARYLPLVRRRGGQPIVAVQRSLVPLLAESALCPVVCYDDPAPPFDLHLPAFSLPWAFDTRLDTVPAEVPYLRTNTQLASHWRQRLADVPGLRVGICWQGNPTYQFDRVRSIPLARFATLAEVSGVRLISLQKGAGREQLAAPRSFDVLDLDAELDEAHGPFMDTAAAIENLDLVITSDSAIAHLAGALGAKVWLALATMADWRWMLDREDTPWYPTMRLFRQPRPGDWSAVMARMAGELPAWVAERGARSAR